MYTQNVRKLGTIGNIEVIRIQEKMQHQKQDLDNTLPCIQR